MFRPDPGTGPPRITQLAQRAASKSSASRKTMDRPHTCEEAPGPEPAERVRTLLSANASTALQIPGVDLPGPACAPAAHALTPDGDLLLLAPSHAPAARAARSASSAAGAHGELAAMLELTDVSPVAVPNRIRGRAWLTGWLTEVPAARRHTRALEFAEQHPVEELLDLDAPERPAEGGGTPQAHWRLLRLELAEASIDDLWGTGTVEPDELATAEPDPLAAQEADLLHHLSETHQGQVEELSALLPPTQRTRLRRWSPRARPIALDRFGLRVRYLSRRGGALDVRFDFPSPASGPQQLRAALHQLFQQARAQHARTN